MLQAGEQWPPVSRIASTLNIESISTFQLVAHGRVVRMYYWFTESLLYSDFHCFFAGRFKLALIQLAVGADKAANIRRACQKVKEAVQNGAGMVVLPVRRNGTSGGGRGV